VPHWVMLGIVLGLLGTSVGVGVSDPGEINLQRIAAERSQEVAERRAAGEEVDEVKIPVQDTNDTGPRLRPSSQGRSPDTTPALAASTSTATSTATSGAARATRRSDATTTNATSTETTAATTSATSTATETTAATTSATSTATTSTAPPA
jgi:hypothetical protein